MGKILNVLNRIWDILGVVFLVGLIVCCWLQVAARFIDSVTITWTDELAGYMMGACCFFGAGTAARFGSHLGAYFIRDKFKGRTLGIVLLIDAVVTMLVLAVLVLGGVEELGLVGDNRATSMPWLGQKWLYIPLIIGCVYMFFYFLRDAVIAVRVIQTGDTSGFQPGNSSPFPAEVNEEC